MIPFSPPHISQEHIDEVIDTLKSGWITTGPKTKLFEKKLAEYCQVPYFLAVNSATFGLEIVLRWFGVKEGDEVIIPSYTYVATANVVVHTGAKPVMVDINQKDFNINIDAVKKAITPKTKVIIPVDIAGYPANYDDIFNLINRPEISKLFQPEHKNQKKLGRILVLADAAHSFGAIYKNKKSGSLADISVFSFHAVKNLTAAEGGGIAINLPSSFQSKKVYEFLNRYSLHGQSKDALAKTKKGNWRYDVLEVGYKGNMTDIQASLGLVSLKQYDNENLKRRKEIFDFYTQIFSQYKWAELPEYINKNKKASYHLFLLRIKNIDENTRDLIIHDIFEQNVSVNVHFQPLPLLTAYKKLNYKIEDYPVSYDNYSRVISLPVYQDLTDDNLNTIVQAVIKSVEKNLK